MIMVLIFMDTYDKGLIENRWFEIPSLRPDWERLIQNRENQENFGFSC